MGAIQKKGGREENSICNAVKLLSVGACEKYMTALFILHSPIMLESMMASGGRGHSECRATPWDPVDATALILRLSEDTRVTSLCTKWVKNNDVGLI